MKKWLLIGSGVLVVGIVVLSLSARAFFTKDFLVREIESSINSRVEIGEVDVSPFSVPARVSLKDVIVAQRDDQAENAVPYADRSALVGGAIHLKSLSFELSLWELLSRTVHVDRFELDGLHVNAVIHADGTNSLDPLFASPEKKKKKSKGPKKEKADEGFNAFEQADFVGRVESVAIKNVSFDLLIEKTGLFIKGTECGVALNDIRVDPKALEVVNEATVHYQSKVEVFDSKSQTVKYGELGLSGPATARIFDPNTGDIDPVVSLDLSISEDSHINTQVPYMQKVWKYADKLSKMGVSLGHLPERATFGRKRKIQGSYHRGRVDLSEDISILLHDWEAAVNQPSWLESGNETHEFFIDFSASKKSSDSIVRHIDSLVKKVPKEVRGNLSEEIKSAWLKNGKLTVSLHTKGKLSSPKIEMLTEVPEIDKLIKDYAKKSAMDYLFKKLGR
jgi:hypothetical protein